MVQQLIKVIGYEETVLMLKLLGIQGKIVEKAEEFLKEFKFSTKDKKIGMIIIAIELPEEMIDYILDFKLNNRRPFVYYLPNIFQPNIDNDDPFLNIIKNSIGQIIM